MAEIIRVEDLTYIYNQGMPDETVALDHVSFGVQQGDFVGIIGSTGSGKSTLITHFNGINRPTSGKIYIGGEDMWADPKQIRIRPQKYGPERRGGGPPRKICGGLCGHFGGDSEKKPV